jgi:opacity protein-like surface antigen
LTARASAQDWESKEPHFYVDGGYHVVTVDDDDLDLTLGMLALTGGYEFGYGLSLEGTIAQGVVEVDIIYDGESIAVKLGTSYGIAARYAFDLGENARIHAKLRYSSIEIEGEALGVSVSESDSSFGFGFGGTYDFNENLYGIVEYNRFASDSNAYYFGVGFRF